MRVLRGGVAITVAVAGVVVALVAGSAPAGAQCSMMGGGHDHAAMQSNRATRSAGSEKKMRQSIERLLSDERGRALLTDALLDDRAFMQALVQRLAANPEWRAMASRQLANPGPSSAKGSDSRVAPNTSPVVYACPMHPDVTSSGPGDCPKCGMALVRGDSRRE